MASVGHSVLSDISNFKAPTAESPLDVDRVHELESQVQWLFDDESKRPSMQTESQQEARASVRTSANATTAATRARLHEDSCKDTPKSMQKPNGPKSSAPTYNYCVTGSKTFGTPLSTILEQRSTASLARNARQFFDTQGKGQHVQRQASRSLDEAALQEFRKIIAHVDSSDLSTEPADDPLDRSVVQGAHANYASSFVRSPTPPDSCRWPGDREPEMSTSVGASPARASRTSSKTVWRSIRDYFRITTPALHGQTAFSRESIDAVGSTRPAWRNSPNTFNHRGNHPFALNHEQSIDSGSSKGPRTSGRNGKVLLQVKPRALEGRLGTIVPPFVMP